MGILKGRVSTLLAGLSIGVVLGAGGVAPSLRAAHAAPAPSRVIVGLKDPVTPADIAEMKRIFRGRVLNVAPDGAYVLVLLRPGETRAQVQARSKRIKFVDPEAPMGFAKEARGDILLIPAPRAPKDKQK